MWLHSVRDSGGGSGTAELLAGNAAEACAHDHTGNGLQHVDLLCCPLVRPKTIKLHRHPHACMFFATLGRQRNMQTTPGRQVGMHVERGERTLSALDLRTWCGLSCLRSAIDIRQVIGACSEILKNCSNALLECASASEVHTRVEEVAENHASACEEC